MKPWKATSTAVGRADVEGIAVSDVDVARR